MVAQVVVIDEAEDVALHLHGSARGQLGPITRSRMPNPMRGAEDRPEVKNRNRVHRAYTLWRFLVSEFGGERTIRS